MPECDRCGTEAEFCCENSRRKVERYKKLLLETKEPLLNIGHRLDCTLLGPDKNAQCDCQAGEVEFLLTRIDLALEK